MASRTALVVGATGIVGLNLAAHLADQGDWTVKRFTQLLRTCSSPTRLAVPWRA
jgi:nucleoside-diphosphate-sugar epimerase